MKQVIWNKTVYVMKYLCMLIIVLLFSSCAKDDAIEYSPTPINLEIPSNFPPLVYAIENNPLTEEGFQLGKSLFYEGKLSSNNSIPCAFCHEQAFAFTHHGHNVSHGVDGGIGIRNSQSIQNLAFQSEFTWDGAATHLDLQPIIPITNEVEMNESLSNVVDKLKADAYYRSAFALAFEDGKINGENLLKALSQFMVMMVSTNSKYDRMIRQEGNETFSVLENDGLVTFQQKCTSCHATDLFTDQSYRNNGLSVNPQVDDKGRYNVFQNPDDLYKFKVPSLRNVEHSFPYMHDGRFETLEAVVNFYDNGLTDNGNVDPLLVSENGSLGIPLTDYEKQSLVAFLKTLTDNEFLQNERFSDF